MLASNGELDLQVSHSQKLPVIPKVLDQSKNKEYKIVMLPKLNHFFQICETGAPSEYGEIEETISPVALKIISDWVLEKTWRFWGR